MCGMESAPTPIAVADIRTTQTDYSMLPEVYGTRSEAHAAAEPVQS
jgi:hypothetical protein